MRPTWWELLDLDWEAEQLLLDAETGAHCGDCGSGLFTNGTCPNCDRPHGLNRLWSR